MLVLMKQLSLVVLACLLSACGGSSPATPAAPSVAATAPLPVAQLSSLGGATWANCLPAIASFPGSCQFQGSIQNVGTGCATAIRGITEFRNGGTPIGTTAAWGLNPSIVMRPNETLVYVTTTETLAIVNQTTGYITTPSWTNVKCQ
jgi:hypothetical protein